ncbi:hypothetical protein AM501_11505 [Aneurinibacillus migulanus]|uniref:DUF3139 domain-containing protein n=1 Tax=Aneurinibacillus migulanus TaxID=47500 RepID=UPI0005B965C6|nr:DUF3139 domain-containing protein [Aneurinibacillus migulanus]KIV58517.1 hypothetical protein TS64_04635 [Aneurinibacillus migulanus]KPD08170.1 hypothetical protein AM501_11505 [Aneurinibacillus migulanus]MCP1357863.1 DUF3139 domain-containing protein [Aneurinibacillus migulanus]
MDIQNKKIYIALCFSIVCVVLISWLYFYYIPQRVVESMDYRGEVEEKIKVRENFLEEMQTKESLTKDYFLEIVGDYDVKTNNYFVKAIYKDEPNVIYIYYKNENGGFWLGHILKDGKPTDESANELKNKHRLAIKYS